MDQIRTAIEAIRRIPETMVGASVEEIAAEIAALTTFKPGPEFDPLQSDAYEAAAGAMEALTDLLARTRQAAAEEEAAREQFRAAVRRLMLTRTAHEVRGLLEGVLINIELDQEKAA